MSQNLADLIAAASAWADQDPDLETRAELEELIDKRDVEALSSRTCVTAAYCSSL